MKRLLAVHIKGKQHTWSFPFRGDPKHIPEWEADGLEVHVLGRLTLRQQMSRILRFLNPCKMS